MHCVDPACAAACMLHAFHKNEVTGVVEWDPFYCVGCRYCQMACPFNVPKFEFDKAVPDLVKCELCRHRVEGAALTEKDGFSRYPKGHGPACCEVCPREAVIYGKRDGAAARGQAPHRRRARQVLRRPRLRRVRGRRHPGALPLARAVREARPADAGEGRHPADRLYRSRKGSTRASSRRLRPTPCSPA